MKHKISIIYLLLIFFNLSWSLFSPLAKYSVALRFNRYGRSRVNLSASYKACGKRKRTVEISRKCFRRCQTDADCKGSKRRCLCDGECGLSCVRITTVCPKIGDFPNGYVNYFPDNFFGAQLVYDCNPGFYLIGEKIRICEGDGWWSGYSPTCVKESYCGAPTSVLNAIPNVLITNETRFKSGTEVEYRCDIGFEMSSESQHSKIVCMDTGRWSDTKFSCSRISCGPPEPIENGLIRGSDHYYSSVIEYRCLIGFKIKSGDYLRECALNSQWTGIKPKCEPIDCGEPPFVKNSVLKYNSTFYNQKVEYVCNNPSFYIENENFLICLSDGRWSGPKPICMEKKCHLDQEEYSLNNYNLFVSPPSVQKTLTNILDYSINTTVKVTCSSGFVLTKDYNEVYCQFNNASQLVSWNREPPKCRKENFCPIIIPPVNGIINSDRRQLPHGYPVNTTIEFKCLFGFVLKGNRFLTCNEIIKRIDGHFDYEAKWSHDESGYCEPVTNPVEDEKLCIIDSIDADIINRTDTDYVSDGGIILYSCRSKPLVQYIAKCINKSFLMQFECDDKNEKRSCLAPPKLIHGYSKYSSTKHGSKVLYQCLNGYELSKGSDELKCINGNWIGSLPVCTKVNCAFPGYLENGKIFYVGTLAEYAYHPYMKNLGQNKQIRYECENGFKLIGPNGSTCINGNWKPSITLVKCLKKDSSLSIVNINDTLKTELDENIISIGLKNERKAKSLFRSNNKRRLNLRRFRQRKNMILRNGRRRKLFNGTLPFRPRLLIRRRFRKFRVTPMPTKTN